MPPKGSGLQLSETDWITRESDSDVACQVCSAGILPGRRVWIDVRSAARHLQSTQHVAAVSALTAAIKRMEAVEEERNAQAEGSSRIQNVRLSAVERLAGPVSATRAPNVPSMAEIEMWSGFAEGGASFSAGEMSKEGGMDQGDLKRNAEVFGILDPEGAAQRLGFGEGSLAEEMLERDEEEEALAELLKNAGISEPTEADIQADDAETAVSDSAVLPVSAQNSMFLLDMLDNLPRMRVSESLMRVFLWVLREAGAENVPSLEGLRKVQKELRAESGIPSIPCISPLGNVFFMNDPRAIVAQDWSNPTTRKLIHVYPEIPEDGVIREIWHAQKWRKDLDLKALSPMYDAGEKHYFVDELARQKNGAYVIPVRWVLYRSSVYADSYTVRINEDGEATVDDARTTLISAGDFAANYLDLVDLGDIPHWSIASSDKGFAVQMPNPKRLIAAGSPIYSSFVDYFGDDVSGNRMKSWNKHWNAYMTHRNLPRKLLLQEFHIHFISTSQNASITEQYREFKAATEYGDTHTEPLSVEDENGQTTKICIYCNAGPSDNPMQSEVSAHIGAKGNRFCRKCKVGGNQAHKMTDTGYHELFEPGIPRTKEYVLGELRKQVALVCGGMSIDKLKIEQRNTGVKDAYTQQWIVGLASRFTELSAADVGRSVADIKAELTEWTKENDTKIYSAFLTTTAFDPTRRDTPVEILHTILIGGVKYTWHISHTSWTAENKATYSLRLQATETNGLSIQAIRANYIMQYANSLVGKQLKTIVQTAVFHVYDLVSPEHMVIWRAMGELSALLWFTEIRNATEYHDDLKIAVANLLDAVAVMDPSKIITKIKYHILVHVADDATAFGPLVGVATELFESFNAVFRYCSIYSNHLAPSRDIALQLGDQEGLKHRLTGGRWLSGTTKRWERSGPGVRQYLEKHPILQRLLGWTPQSLFKSGDIKILPLQRGTKIRVPLELSSTGAAHAVNYSDHDPKSLWDRCKSLFSQSLDECIIGSWIFAELPADKTVVFPARITDILKGSECNLVVLERFSYSSTRDPTYGMPVLTRPQGEVIFTIVGVESIKFIVNVQHDCREAKCAATGIRPVMQAPVGSSICQLHSVH
ncbi:hypothetical protein C8F01DRAFT_1375116 [Mycena amicta]|nr:hypothetical protein C8F01DRAFT_1375116 [Mycena amicta]